MEAMGENRITHEWTHQKDDRVIERHEYKRNAFRFLANLRPSSKVDGELCALRFGPFLKVVEDVLDLLEGDVVVEANHGESR